MKDKINQYIVENLVFAKGNLTLDEYKQLLLSVLSNCFIEIQDLLLNK